MNNFDSALSISMDLEGHGKKTFSSYEDMVDFFSQNNIDHTFSNSNIDHSVMLINKFLENIDGTLCLYTKNFKKTIFNNSKLILKIKEFLKRDEKNEVRVLIEDANYKQEDVKKNTNVFCDSLIDSLKNKRVSIKNVEGIKGSNHRYMVMRSAYRFSKNAGDDKDFSASVNFNNPKDSKILQKHFNDVYDNHSRDMSWS